MAINHLDQKQVTQISLQDLHLEDVQLILPSLILTLSGRQDITTNQGFAKMWRGIQCGRVAPPTKEKLGAPQKVQK